MAARGIGEGPMRGARFGERAGAEAGPYAWVRWMLIKCVCKRMDSFV